MTTKFIGITTKVNAQSIRRENYNGSEHWVVPSYTLPANVVMNGGLYTANEIDAHYQGLENTLAPLGHPKVNGVHVSAHTPEGLNRNHIGAFNRNVKKAGNRIYVEKWIDIEVAGRSAPGQRLIERLEAMERGDDVPPIHTSVAGHIEEIPVKTNGAEGLGYSWVAKIHQFDHDAILLDEVGAATPEQGVGMLVNADIAQAPRATEPGDMGGVTYRQREEQISKAARERFATGEDDYVWVADFTETQAIIVAANGEAALYDYTQDGDAVTFGETGVPVERKESWVRTLANSLKRFITHQARPDTSQESDMSLTTEEKAALTKDITDAVVAQVGEVVANAIKPIDEAVQTLQTNHDALSESLTANQRAEETAKRAEVAKVHGEVVANSLSGEALDALHKNLGSAAAISTNGQLPNGDTDLAGFDQVID